MTSFLRRLSLEYLKPYRKQALALLGCIVLVVAFETLFPLSIKYIIDLAITPGDLEMFLWLVGGITLLFLVASVANPTLDYLMIWLSAHVLNDRRHQMYAHLQDLSAGTHQELQAGDVLTRFSSDLNTMEYGFYYAVIPGIQHVLALLVGSFVLFQLDWRLALLTVVLLPVPILLPRRTMEAATRATYRRKEADSEIVGEVQEALLAQPTVRAFGLRDRFLGAFDVRLDDYAATTVRADFLQWFAYRITNTGQYFIQLMAIAFGGYLALRGQLSIGSLVGFTSLLYVLGGSLTSISNAMAALIPTITSDGRIQKLLAEPITVPDAPGAAPIAPLREELSFDGVTFGYLGPARPQLRRVSFALAARQSVALVGRSGSGKSTVLSLLQRNYDPNEGRILIDGCDIATVSLASLRGQMGLVSQDNFLFNQSIRENIRLGRPEATDAEIVEAARAAGVHEVIVELPEGYDTPVGERGGRLSGGQRQRIALARALVRQPAILLLDEATSALDPESEAAISETLQDLAGRCTILSVTHRLAPVASMDHIIVMDHGQVIEQGNHTELMAQEGLYYRLFTQQSGFSVSGDGLHGKITTARLRSIPLFADVDEAGLARLASQFIAEPYPAGRPVFRQADAGDKFYIVARGRVAVTVAGNQGPETRLDVLQDGDYFGEIALLEDVPRTATVETLLPSLFLTLNRQHFLAMLSEFPGIRAAVERAAAARRLDLSAAMQP